MTNDIGKATDGEIWRMEELAEEYFVKDSWSLDIRCWDDGDVHLTAYSTIGSNVYEGYPMSVVFHRQTIEYERNDDTCLYKNRLKISDPKPDKILDRERIDF